MRTPSGTDGPVLDPRLDELPFPVLLRQRADARGITTLRQLASIPPAQLMTHPSESVVLADVRAVLERYLGRTWEELATGKASPGTFPPAEPRLPASWDELRLVLPATLRAAPLDGIGLPPRMLTYVERRDLQTLRELGRQSETFLLGEQKIGRLTVHRTFVAVVAFARGAGTPVVMPPPAPMGRP
jgi:hypothetical protein